MSLTLTLHVDAQVEPKGFHKGDFEDEHRAFAVSLALKAQIPADEEQDEAAAKAALDAFFDALADGVFYLLRFAKDGTITDWTKADVLFEPGTPKPDLSTWLEDTKDALLKASTEDQIPFYLSPADQRETASIDNIRAFELQKSAARWPAPAAQNAGLLRAVHTKDAIPDPNDGTDFATLVFLPEGADALAIAFESEEDGRVTLTCPWLDGTTINAQCDILDPNEVLPAAFGDDGTIALPNDAQALGALMGRITERSPAEFWATPILAGMLTQEWSDPPTEEEKKRFAWLAKAAVTCILDPVILGLFHGRIRTDNVNRDRQPMLLALAAATIATEVEALGHDIDLDDEALLTFLEELDITDQTDGVVAKAQKHFGLTSEPTRWPKASASLTGELATDDLVTTATELSDELNQIIQLIEDENELETFLVKLLNDHLFPEGTLAKGAAACVLPKDQAAKLDLAPAFKAGMASFAGLLKDRLNAADMLRQDLGATYADILLPGSQKLGDLKTALKDANPLLRRHFQPGTEKLDALLDLLPPTDFPNGEDPTGGETTIGDWLNTRWTATNDDIAMRPEDDVNRFRPDLTPQPLMLPYVALSGQALAEASQKTSGIIYLIRPEGADVSYLNLITLEAGGTDTPTLDPAMPVGGGVIRNPTLPYTGEPLSSPNRDIPVVGGESAGLLNPADLRPFKIDDPDYKASGHSPVPALAYGTQYQVRAYWVPPSGVLPKVLQSDTSPFVPRTNQADLEKLFPDIETPPAISYRRRTAIAEMALDHARPKDDTDAQALPTLGQIPQGVHPLALEEPRFLLPGDGSEGRRWRTLYRRPDGTGMLGPGTSVTLDRIAIPDRSNLTVEVLTGKTVARTLTFGAADIENDSLTITLPDSLPKAQYWLRLQSTNAPISFGDPAAGSAVEPAAPPPAPVLLLAPKQAGWSIKPNAKLWLQLPRVSFADFDRWARKTALMTQTAGDKEKGQTLANLIRRTRSVLIAAKSNRRDEIDRLPDPAVIGVLIGGAVTHRTTETEAAPIASKWISTNPYTKLTLNPLPEDGDKLLKKAEENLDKIAEASRLTLGINVKGKGVDHPLTCQPGMVTRLWATPGILMANIDDAITEPLNRLKVGKYTDGMTEIALFDGPKLSVEVARGIETKDKPVLDDALVPRIPKTARSYTLEVDLSPKGPRGALFSVAAPSTQRWRPTGLPIPVTLNPSLANPAARQSVVQILRKDHKDTLDEFETEIYRTRSEADADLRSVRLQGAGLTTEVHRIDWPERSATYLRHKLRLISRYAAVMTADDDSIQTGDTDWACRMAILADPLRADITRPQIRAYQPLLSRSADRKTSPAPPILCTLSEPPYAQLGLAERIDAEIQTRPVYTFEDRQLKEDGSQTEDPILAVDSLRKEVGGDPLLTPYRIGADRSRSVTLQTLGVIGLHFDDPETAAPAFVNSMVRIDLNIPPPADETSPEARATDLEETFVEVSLTRRADPNWSVGIPLQSDRAETAATAIGDQHDYWLLARPAPRRDTPVFKLRSSKTISTIYAEGGAGGITILGQSLFPVSEPADYAKKPFSLWSKSWSAVLLSSQGDRRYRLSVFHTDLDTGRLEPAASITFQADDPMELETNTIIQPTRVSEPTSARWVKTARDMSTMARGSDGLAVSVADLSAHVITGTTVGFRHALEPTKSLVVQPPSALHETTRYLHRRLIQILLWPTPQTGHRRLVGRPDDPEGPDSGVVALCGGDGAAEHRTITGATALQLAEIEIPAQPIRAVGLDSKDAPYSDAHFDLKAIGAEIPQTCRFFFRASASPIPAATLKVRITSFDAEGEPLSPLNLIDLGPILADKAETLRWFELILRHDGAPDLIVPTKDGDRERIPLEELGTLTLPAGAHSLTLRVETGQEELTWMDVSFLHTRKSKEAIGPDGFDFDWIFGLPGDIDLSLTDSVKAPHLAKVHEAQAAPRGLSDTIPIRPD